MTTVLVALAINAAVIAAVWIACKMHDSDWLEFLLIMAVGGSCFAWAASCPAWLALIFAK